MYIKKNLSVTLTEKKKKKSLLMTLFLKETCIISLYIAIAHQRVFIHIIDNWQSMAILSTNYGLAITELKKMNMGLFHIWITK